MKNHIGVACLLMLAVSVLGACGSGADAGLEACTIYQSAMEENPQAISSYIALDEIKPILSEADDLTRRAFAGLISVSEDLAGPPGATDEKVATAREVCLSEHSIEIPTY